MHTDLGNVSTKYGLLSKVEHMVGATDGASIGQGLIGAALGGLGARDPAPQPLQLNSHSTAS